MPSKYSEEDFLAKMSLDNDTFDELQLNEKTPDTSRSLPTEGWRTRWLQNKSILLMILAQLISSFMSTSAKLLQTRGGENAMSASQILFSMMSIIMVLSWICMWGLAVPNAPFGQKKVWWLLLGRGVSGFIGIWGYYYSLRFLHISEATVINFLAPMAAAFACAILLRTPFSLIQQLAGIVSIIGVVLIAKPWHMVSDEAAACQADVAAANMTLSMADCVVSVPDGTSIQHIIAIAIAFIGVCGGACAYLSVAWIGSRAHPIVSVTYFATATVLLSALMMPLKIGGVGDGFRWPEDGTEWALLGFLGVFGFAMQALMAASLALDGENGSSRALNVVYVQIIFAIAIDKLVWGVLPDWSSLVGGVLVLASVITIALKREGTESVNGLCERVGGGACTELEREVAIGQDQGHGDGDERQVLIRKDEADVEKGEHINPRRASWEEVPLGMP